jgi:hypothetical protein
MQALCKSLRRNDAHRVIERQSIKDLTLTIFSVDPVSKIKHAFLKIPRHQVSGRGANGIPHCIDRSNLDTLVGQELV